MVMEKVEERPPSGRKRGAQFKLSRARALEMRSAYFTSSSTVKEVAGEFGITVQTLYNILARLRWESAHGPIAGWE